MDQSSQIVQYILSGLSNGAIYALIGFGFAIIYNATGIINFAQGEFVMLGGMLTIFFLGVFELTMVPSILLAVFFSTVTGVLFERLAIRPLKNASPLGLVIITIGASILIRGGAMLLWGKDTHALPPFSGNDPLHILGATMLPQNLWIVAVTVVIIAASRFFFHYSIFGKAMRACAFNRQAASLVGLKGFSAAIIGGMSSGLGTVAGGLLLGILESLGAGLISAGYKDAIAFVILLGILFLRPEGLFGKKETERV